MKPISYFFAIFRLNIKTQSLFTFITSQTFKLHRKIATISRQTWLAEPEVAEQARFYEFHPTQKLTEQPDGSLLIEFTASGLKEMAYYLFTWEGKIKILAPDELKEEYTFILKKLK